MAAVFSLINVFKKLKFIQTKENGSKTFSQQNFHASQGKSVSVSHVVFLSEVSSCSRAIVTSIAELQVRKSKIFRHVNELDKYRVCNMKEFELGVLFSFVRVEAN